MKSLKKHIPIFSNLASKIYRKLKTKKLKSLQFQGSKKYWEKRYFKGGNSGVGSYGKFAAFKAAVINEFVNTHKIEFIIEFGCGDGQQLTLAAYPNYLGFDISKNAITICQKLFEGDNSKRFRMMSDYYGKKADLTLSLDVIYHLIEDDVYHNYMSVLFESSKNYVIIYSSNSDDNNRHEGAHVKHRKFTKWVLHNMQCWRLIEHIPNMHPYKGDYKSGSFSDFYIFAKN